MKYLLVSLLAIAAIQGGSARIIERCDLARELLWQGFPRDVLEHWVCLVEGESRGDTGVVGGPNTDGSYDWGLFQINDRYWCRPGEYGGDCNTPCEALLSDDISVASSCSQLIYSRMGFSAWTAWTAYCQGPLPDLGPCGV